MDSGPLVRLNGITKRHDGSAALDDVSLSVPAGSLLALVGPSGSGKTTLLKTINRLTEPDEGFVIVAGEDVRTLAPASLRRRIGYVFQGIGLFPHMTEALLLADRIVVLIDGRIRADAPPSSLIRGGGDAEVRALVEVPRRQSERLAALERGG